MAARGFDILERLIHDCGIARFRIELAEQRDQRRREIKIAHAREQPHLRPRHGIDGAQRGRRETRPPDIRR